MSAEIDNHDASISVVVDVIGTAPLFERKLQPRLLGLALALLFFPLSDLLDDERR